MTDSERMTLNLDEVAAQLGISYGGAYTLAKRGDLPVLRTGLRRVVVDKEAFEEWKRSRVSKPGFSDRQTDRAGAPDGPDDLEGKSDGSRGR